MSASNGERFIGPDGPSQGMDVLLTNDDGYDSPGLHAIADGLRDVGHPVTIVAPAVDQSATGRARSARIEWTDRGDDVIVSGTPADCVILGCTGLDVDVDVVVAGCNVGGNLGSSTLGHSGTVGAAIEACHLGYPAIATSLAIPEAHWPLTPTRDAFGPALPVLRRLVDSTETWRAALPTGYLNVNVPYAVDVPRIAITEPAAGHLITARVDGNAATIEDASWDRMASAEPTWPATTDRGALEREWASISPLESTPRPVRGSSLEALFDDEFDHGAGSR